MSETQTPRTDRAIAKWRECGLHSWQIMTEIESFARRLERELADPGMLDTLDWNRLRSGNHRALNPDNQPLFDRFYAAPAESGEAWRELWNIANAERFNRERFRDDTEFADWAQSRCRHAARSPDGEK